MIEKKIMRPKITRRQEFEVSAVNVPSEWTTNSGGRVGCGYRKPLRVREEREVVKKRSAMGVV